MNRISKHITYAEATRSNTAKQLGIDNKPNECQLVNMKILAENVFEAIRSYFKVPIYVSSMFRSEEVNKAIKGAKNSQHLCNNGAAIDVDADVYGRISNLSIFFYILDNLDFDQLIAEDIGKGKLEWVHISYISPEKNRNQVLLMHRVNGRTVYESYTRQRLEELLDK